MPSTTITLFQEAPADRKRTIMAAVHNSLVEAFKIPEDDRFLRLFTLDEDSFMMPPDRSRQFVFIEIDMFKGRSQAAKQALVETIYRELDGLGIAAIDVKILLREQPLEHWGLRGTVASKLDLGFKVNV